MLKRAQLEWYRHMALVMIAQFLQLQEKNSMNECQLFGQTYNGINCSVFAFCRGGSFRNETDGRSTRKIH